MKSLYTAVRKTGSPSERIVEACRDFDLPEVDEGDLKVVCAGNEVNFLWNLFVKIADGSSVDQMYDAQFKVGSTQHKPILSQIADCRRGNLSHSMTTVMTRKMTMKTHLGT